MLQQIFDFFRPAPAAAVTPNGAGAVPGVEIRRSARARRYRLSVKRDGSAVLTIPPRGSKKEAMTFLEQHEEWLDRARDRMNRKPRPEGVWFLGTRVLFRGEWSGIEKAAGPKPAVSIGGKMFRVRSVSTDLRPTLEAHLRRLAKVEMTARTWELAAIIGAEIKRVVIRSQRTRWGSCSTAGTISLNWRLVQAPSHVIDYVILHELVHTRHMNHSGKFWDEVGNVCPDWREGERWLKENGPALGL